jgi:hypothetical protein
MTRSKLYTLILVISSAGYAWLGWNLFTHATHGDEHFTVCMFKSLTGIPCPACGVTRSILSLMHADFSNAFLINPLGFFLLAALIILPVWVSADLLKKANSFFRFYIAAEKKLAQKVIALPAIVLISANWIWNIYKHL